MRNLTHLLTLLALVLLWGCAEDLDLQPSADVLSADQAELVAQKTAEADARITTALRELEAADSEPRAKAVVMVPAESNDALAAAIATAGPSGTVVLASGNHYESGTIAINARVTLRGEPGAVLITDLPLGDFASSPTTLVPALHIKDADRTLVQGIEFRPAGESGRAGIVVEESRRVRIADNRFYDFQVSVFLYGATQAQLTGNYVRGLQSPVRHYGFVASKGLRVLMYDNEIEQSGGAVFVSDLLGIAYRNNFHDNVGNGMVICTFPDFFYALPDGTPAPAPEPAKQWLVMQNDVDNNGELGFSIIDGANNNWIINNRASGNGVRDMTLFPDLDFSGLFLPAAYDNLVISSSQPDVTIMDCGIDNTVIGGTQEDCNF